MKVFDKVKVPVAAHKPITIDLSCQHITTSDFMQLNVPYIRRMIPREKLKVDFTSFARLSGMKLPTYGKANLNLRAFFVPYRVIFKGWLDFMEGSSHVFGDGVSTPATITQAPYFTNADIVTMFTQSIFSRATPSGETGDFVARVLDTSVSQPIYIDMDRQFTADGRVVYKILRQLGYSVMFDLEAASTAGYINICALDLLAYLKVYLDYYFPSAYYNLSTRTTLEQIINRDIPTMQISYPTLLNIFTLAVMVSYANDYFTAAFDNPVGPNSAEPATAIRDSSIGRDATGLQSIVTNTGSGDYGSTNGTPVLARASATTSVSSPTQVWSTNLSEYALMSLRKLTDFLKRHQLVGGRAVDRFLAQFGVKVDDRNVGRSVYLGSHHIPMIVSEVMSTADTASDGGAALGEYAGKGFLKAIDPKDSVAHFTCDSGEDYGVFFILSSIVPQGGYYQGYDIQTLNSSRLSFYTPEFDGLGTRAIEKGEVFVPIKAVTGASTVRNVFGFTPQYSEYKIGKDRCTGDFDVASFADSGFTSSAWHLFRKFAPTNMSNIAHNYNFVRAADKDQYLRIFNNATFSADHFVLVYDFKVTSNLPVKPLYDSYEFEHDTNGEVSVAPNGNRVN